MRYLLRTSVLGLCLSPCVVRGQCKPPRGSHEARLLAFYSVPVVFTADPSMLATPSSPELRVAVEGAYVPTPSASVQHTEYCYTGKAEHTGLTSVFGRPRVALTLPSGFGAEFSYLPSVTISEATPNLVSGAVWFTRLIQNGTALTFRVHGTTGTIRGPITCPKDALQQGDPNGVCYGNAPSMDEFKPQMAGEELIVQKSSAATPVSFVAGVGVNQLLPRFRVGFSDLNGGTDHTTISVNLTRYTAFLGGTFRFAKRCAATAEGYASISDVETVRGFASCRIF